MINDEIILYQQLYPGASYGYLNRLLTSKSTRRTLRCKCGKFRRFNGTKILGTCGDKECHAAYGKKRPEHSIFMKEFTSSGKNSGAFTKGCVNTFINTKEWKKTSLINAGINVDNLSDDEFEKIFSKFRSNNAKK